MDLGEALRIFSEAGQKDKIKENREAQDLYSTVIKLSEACLAENKIKEVEIERLLSLSYNNRGHLRYLKVDFDGAIADYTTAIHYGPSLAVAYYNRGLIHYRLGRFQSGLDDMKQVLQLDQDFDSAKQCMDQCLAKLLPGGTTS